MDKKEQTRLRVVRYREKQKALQKSEEVTQDVTQETVPASYIEGLRRTYEFLPERPRYLTLSDGQVLDRANQPTALKEIAGMKASNDAYQSKVKDKARQLALIIRSLDKEVTGLDGKRVNLQSMVRYGVSGLTFGEIKATLIT